MTQQPRPHPAPLSPRRPDDCGDPDPIDLTDDGVSHPCLERQVRDAWLRTWGFTIHSRPRTGRALWRGPCRRAVVAEREALEAANKMMQDTKEGRG